VISGLKVVIKIKYGQTRNAYKIWSENMKGRDHSEDLGVNGGTILEWTLGKQDGRLWTGLIWLMTGASGGLL